jgi:hypothetical protein
MTSHCRGHPKNLHYTPLANFWGIPFLLFHWGLGWLLLLVPWDSMGMIFL